MQNDQETIILAVNLIKQIPDVVWAAIIACALTSIGVFFTNRNSRIQQQAGLRHDSEQRDREREMSLRRDVYLKATEAITKGQNFLIRLANLDIPSQAFDDDYREDAASLAKIHIVATNETVQAVLTYSQYFRNAFLELSLKRVSLLARKNRIEVLDSFIEQTAQKGKYYLEQIGVKVLEGTIDERVWKILNDNFQFESEQQDKYEKERQQLTAIQQKEQMEFFKLCMERFFSISEYLPLAVIAVRNELELSFDEEAYLGLYKENLEKSRIVFNNFLREAEYSNQSGIQPA